MSQEELQAAVISYANRFIATIGQAAFQMEEKIPTRQGRLIAAARKVYSISSAAEIAAGPNAGPALLDLVVMTTLNRMVWEFYWRPQVFGMPASIMVDAFKKMEADAWDLAAKVMTSTQLEEFRDLILDWYADNPEQVSVDYIRFSDFGDLGKKPHLKEIQKPGGLLAPVREATAAVDEVRMTSERAMFLLTKMQLIMGFQAELIYKQLVMQPETNKILEDISGFRTTADRFADLLEQLPRQVADERSAMFTDAERLIARERTAILKAFDDKSTAIHQINKNVQETLNRVGTTFGSLQKTNADAERLIQGAQQTVREMKDLMAAVDGLVARFEPKDPATPSKTFDINEYTALLVKIQETVGSLNQLTQSVNETSTPMITHILEEFNDAADTRVDHIFWRLLQLLAATGVIILVILVVNQRQKQTRK
ncbi:MAG: hypothetical protein HGJ94_10090 [Desulfosarcina sp.]|nr:hypothetical protein [Desulfosarcina sp.]